ncbi:MAG TPA: hypothetical protein VMU05_14555 [Dongiaceae bacterium]|nr:hypothetical protein [Dongiaceae bacterium]
MAIVFELWAECATEEEREVLIKHFDGFTVDLLTRRTISFHAGHPYPWKTSMTVSSRDLSNAGVRTLDDAIETTEVGLQLYHHLKKGPPFRFARAAWEASLIPMAELNKYVAPLLPGECRLELECVLDDALYKQFGSPKWFFPFREGYWWNRYSGEQYKPLYSSDQAALNKLGRSLFPEYFKY